MAASQAMTDPTKYLQRLIGASAAALLSAPHEDREYSEKPNHHPDPAVLMTVLR